MDSPSADMTERMAKRLSARLKGGEVIELVGDLGSGKTTFVRGLAAGLNSRDVVASPSFTISKVYRAGALAIHHFDFYRLREAGVMANELAESAGDPGVITVVEWADIVQHVLPACRLTVRFTPQADGVRRLTFQCPNALHYAVERLDH